ncbi:MAG: response regulator [Deltaproteobacteria bacterium]|nr:response regulator [Deltaproteobacteria bacterium]
MSQSATVLLVDDDVDTIETMRVILEEEGHNVLSAHNGRDALAIVLAELPDLVLLDLNMPEMDGRAFLEEVRHHPSLEGLVVVVLSGAADAEVLPCESVTKPLRLDTLLGLIDRVADASLRLPTSSRPSPSRA